MTTVIDIVGLGPREPKKRMGAQSFTILVRHSGSKDAPWEEQYNESTDDPEAWAKALIERFNDTLRPGERAREFVGMKGEATATVAPEHHNWEKQNLMTVMHGGRLYDRVKCTHCGITGKRLGVSSNVKRDSQYRAKVYARCDATVTHLAKRKGAEQ